MSEEVRRAKHAVPRALFWTIAINGILAYAMVIAILAAMGNIDDALSSSFPFIVIIHTVTGSTPATTALVVGLFVISFAVCLASIASVLRLTWAWSRDRGLPSLFSVVSCGYCCLQSWFWKIEIAVVLFSHETGQPQAPSPLSCHLARGHGSWPSFSPKHWKHCRVRRHHCTFLVGSILLLLHRHQLHVARPLQGQPRAAWRLELGPIRCGSQHLRPHLHSLGHDLLTDS